MYGAFPAIAPYRSGFLGTSDGQQIYFEESGNPTGLPVVIMHGGSRGIDPTVSAAVFSPDSFPNHWL